MSQIIQLVNRVSRLKQECTYLNITYPTKECISYVLKTQHIQYIPSSANELEDAYLSILLKRELDDVIDITLRDNTEYTAIGLKDGQPRIVN